LVLTKFIRSRERVLYKGGNKYDFEDSGFIFSLDFLDEILAEGRIGRF